MGGLQWLTVYLGLALVFVWGWHSGKGLISVFQEFCASINGACIFFGGGGGLGAGLLFYGV